VIEYTTENYFILLSTEPLSYPYKLYQIDPALFHYMGDPYGYLEDYYTRASNIITRGEYQKGLN
jgi:hypothetical protein